MPARSPAQIRVSPVGPPVGGLSRMPVVAVTTVVSGLGEAELDQAQAGVTPGVVNVADQPPVVVTVVHARRVDQPDVSTDPMVQLALRGPIATLSDLGGVDADQSDVHARPKPDRIPVHYVVHRHRVGGRGDGGDCSGELVRVVCEPLLGAVLYGL